MILSEDTISEGDLLQCRYDLVDILNSIPTLRSGLRKPPSSTLQTTEGNQAAFSLVVGRNTTYLPGPPKQLDQTLSRDVASLQSLPVDGVVADEGRTWIRVNNIKNS